MNLKNKYITDSMISKLNYAYHHEISNAVFYDYISSYLDVLGYKNLSDYWEDWAKEEKKHSKWVRTFMQQVGISLSPGQLESFNYDLNSSLIEFINVTMDREDKTTKLYHNILDVALGLDDSAMLVQFANMMLNEQIEETDKAGTIYSKIINIGEDKGLLQLFDNGFKD